MGISEERRCNNSGSSPYLLIAGLLESAYSLIWGSHKIWGKGGWDT